MFNVSFQVSFTENKNLQHLLYVEYGEEIRLSQTCSQYV